MKDIGVQWESYMQLGKMVADEVISKEDFEKQILIFSSYLSETNPDYHYNATYLPEYIDEFWDFMESFNKKYPFVKRLFDASSCYTEVSLTIDRYWQQTSTWDEEKKAISVTRRVFPYCEKKRVCSDIILIECSVLCKTKRFIYHSEIGNNEKELQQELEKIETFLNEKVSSEADTSDKKEVEDEENTEECGTV